MPSQRRSLLPLIFACLCAVSAFAQPSVWDKPNPNSPWDKPDPNSPSTPPQPSLAPATGLNITGNWIAEYRDWKGVGDVARFALIVRPPVTLQCTKALNGGCHLIKTPDNTSEWLVYQMSRPDRGIRIPRRTQAGMLTMDAPYASFFAAEGSVTRIAPAGANEMRGQWTHGYIRNGEPGAVHWQRQVPRIARVKFISGLESETAPGGAPAQVRFAYVKDGWNSSTPEYHMHGPRFTVEVYGQNLWGYHHVHLPTAVDMIASDPEPIHSGPAGDLPTNVIGFRVTVRILGERPGSEREIPKATPGRKTLVIDNVVIPFDLEIPGFPGETTTTATIVGLRYVELRDGKYVPIIGELKHGTVFFVEASFDGPPAEKQYVVKLDWAEGPGAEVKVTPSSDTKVFRSEAIRLQAPVVKR